MVERRKEVPVANGVVSYNFNIICAFFFGCSTNVSELFVM
jgi:hypothetical protein